MVRVDLVRLKYNLAAACRGVGLRVESILRFFFFFLPYMTGNVHAEVRKTPSEWEKVEYLDVLGGFRGENEGNQN